MATMRKYRYRRNLPHLQKDDRAVFVSFNSNGRWELPPIAREIAMECVRFQHRKKIWLHAAVIMPEHVHMIFHVARDTDGPVSVMEILQNVKSISSRRIKKALAREARVWQEESFDHVLRSVEKLDDRVEYLRQNPVRRGLCRRPRTIRGCG
jgi:REP element-mobilizing transposase RayT